MGTTYVGQSTAFQVSVEGRATIGIATDEDLAVTPEADLAIDALADLAVAKGVTWFGLSASQPHELAGMAASTQSQSEA